LERCRSQVSRDEVAEMVRDNSLKPDLQELWADKSAQQKALQRLCAAAAAGDLDAIRVGARLENNRKMGTENFPAWPRHRIWEAL
jgi:hypothetical protein